MITSASVMLIVTVSLLAAVGCSSGPPQGLRGPASEVGMIRRDEMKMTMTKGEITMTAGGASETGQIEMAVESALEEETLAVANGQISKARTKVVTDKSTETIRIGAEKHTHADPSPLHGEMVESEKVGEEWKFTLVGKTPTKKQELDLKHFSPPDGRADFYPAEPVRPGHSWNVDAAKLKRFMGSGVEITSGSCKMKFQKTLTMNNELCAEITEDLAIVGKMRDEHGQMQVELKVSGTGLRSLKQGLTLSSKMIGTVTMSGTVPGERGEKIQTKITGPVTVDYKSQLQKANQERK